ncbi:3-deoxy-manno-octulosonate cytidylyltransferase [Sphingomicrobium aestuariivivum]|uniref:3-deoxy-manno-octulosonate cytidylyltransferase n=1 Tax=Sphingomicrobium aestuariivivum TaxID=1582356 RepID=UPI001FD68832|nr:manno-octulosonate cytidylyltransferase [Sphingomicrobium aestuariivivum]MCJ8191579.1 3-deoxy-manno-octulosonate cytidylyltransferase [Sphingomicrobium aestuariivivum]
MSGPVIIIPARYASQRFPGKPLAMLKGRDGVSKSLIRRSWEAAMTVRGADGVYVATDDERIATHVRDFGGEVLMTPANCGNGTERCARALEALDDEPEMVVNLQGDAPLTPHWFVEPLMAALRTHDDVDMVTPVLRADAAHYEALLADRRAGRVGGTTVVRNAKGHALYFSKEVLPFIAPEEAAGMAQLPVFHHVGVYAYRPEVLRRYLEYPVGTLERLEGLEQLRFLEQGRAILCEEVDARGRVFWELNNPEDVERIERALDVA